MSDQQPPFQDDPSPDYASAPPPPPPPPPGYAPPPPQPPGYAAPPGEQPLSQSDERLWAMLGHLSELVLAIIGPLLIMVLLGKRSAFVDDLRLLLDELKIDRAALVGQSMGGGTCAAFTCRYPERVVALAVCDSLAAIRLPEPHASELTALNAATRDFSQAQRVLGKTTLATDPERTLLYLQIASFNSVTLKTVKGTPLPWSPAELAATAVPVLYLAGEEDVICTPALVRATHRLTPGSRYVELPKSGHSAYFETPSAFNAALLQFLAASCRADLSPGEPPLRGGACGANP